MEDISDLLIALVLVVPSSSRRAAALLQASDNASARQQAPDQHWVDVAATWCAAELCLRNVQSNIVPDFLPPSFRKLFLISLNLNNLTFVSPHFTTSNSVDSCSSVFRAHGN
jgi:hypothetical protein